MHFMTAKKQQMNSCIISSIMSVLVRTSSKFLSEDVLTASPSLTKSGPTRDENRKKKKKSCLNIY